MTALESEEPSSPNSPGLTPHDEEPLRSSSHTDSCRTVRRGTGQWLERPLVADERV